MANNTDAIQNPNAKKHIVKSIGDTYLYNANMAMYQKNLMNAIMTSKRIDKQDSSFEDIRYDIKKRQVTSYLVKILDSDNVILLNQPTPLPKAFKVFTARDIKENGKLKVFIDTSGLINFVNGKWTCNSIDILVAYLISGMNELIYYVDPKRLLMRDKIISNGASAFSKLFTYIIDYLFKINSVSSVRDRCIYLSASYYIQNILGKDMSDSNKRLCRNLAGISEREEEMVNMYVEEDSFDNIDLFIKLISKILKLNKLTLDAFLEKWLYIYGTGTQFSLELYPAFATMMINVYVGCYLNNQKTIEKVIGRDVVDIVTTILNVGGESL